MYEKKLIYYFTLMAEPFFFIKSINVDFFQGLFFIMIVSPYIRRNAFFFFSFSELN